MTFSIDPRLVACLCDALPLTVFVETGTFEGEAVASVAPSFDEVHTIEIVEDRYTRAHESFRARENVTTYLGDSPDVLRQLRTDLHLSRRPVMFWLDAHGCGTIEMGAEGARCPLLDELDAIHSLNDDSVVLIDDARLFLATPPQPDYSASWPSLGQLLRSLETLSDRHEAMVINDVIVFFPSRIAVVVSEYARTNGLDLLATIHRLRQAELANDMLRRVSAERLAEINEKEAQIVALTKAAQERLEVIERLVAAQVATDETATE